MNEYASFNFTGDTFIDQFNKKIDEAFQGTIIPTKMEETFTDYLINESYIDKSFIQYKLKENSKQNQNSPVLNKSAIFDDGLKSSDKYEKNL